jgi:hypothetical protein
VLTATDVAELFKAAPLPVGTVATFTGDLFTVRVPLPDGGSHEGGMTLRDVPDGIARTMLRYLLEQASMAPQRSRSALRVRRVRSEYLGVRFEVLDLPAEGT